MRGFVRLGGGLAVIVSSPEQATVPSTPAEQSTSPALPAEDDDVILDEEGNPTRSEDGSMLRSE